MTVAGAEGFEPSALGFGDRCSDQTELRPYRPKANSTQYDRGMAAYLANVGVNAAHAARSPLDDDGCFRLIPIPEPGPWKPPMLRFGDLVGLAEHAPASWQARPAHLDP